MENKSLLPKILITVLALIGLLAVLSALGMVAMHDVMPSMMKSMTGWCRGMMASG
jgi:hypothetical protein